MALFSGNLCKLLFIDIRADIMARCADEVFCDPRLALPIQRGDLLFTGQSVPFVAAKVDLR